MRIHLSLATLSVLGFLDQKYMASLGVWLYCKDKVCDIVVDTFIAMNFSQNVVSSQNPGLQLD